MKIGIFVGSFNPVHIGHIKIAKELIEKGYVDKIYFIPTGNYWDKNNLIDIKDRINMLRLVSSNDILVDEIHNDYKYTYEILSDFRKNNPNDVFYLIIGADNLEKFHMWMCVDKILEGKVLVLNRNNINLYEYINRFENNDNFIVASDIIPIDISSTMIRKNKKYRNKYLDKRVLKYIKDNNLYN